MKLYFSPGACSLAPHILMRCAGMTFDMERVDLRTSKLSDGRDYYEINTKGCVPGLVLDDSELLTENAVILQYIADQVPDKKLIPACGSRERYRAQMMLNYITTEIHKGFSPLFNPAMPEEAKTITRTMLGKRFDWISTQLTGKDYLMGDKFTAPDAYLFTVLRWSEHCGMELKQWPLLTEYRERIKALPYVIEAMKVERLIR